MQTVSHSTDQAAIDRLHSVFSKQKTAFQLDPYPPASVRIDRLRRIDSMVRQYRKAIHEALDADFGGHASQQGDTIEIFTAIERVKHSVAQVKKWMKPVKRPVNPVTMGHSKAYIKYHPKGVIGNMVPWNFPFDIGLGPTIDAVTSGNRVIIKPSELSPASGQLLEEMIRATFDEEEVAVVNGGLELAQTFAATPWDHLVYTGSTRVAKLIMQAAAQNLVPVTLELGGKNPTIFHKSALTDQAIQEVAGIKSIKRGQMCVGVDYCLVPAGTEYQVAKVMQDFFQTHFGQDDHGAQQSCGIINSAALDRLTDMVAEAKAAGVEVIETGNLAVKGHRHMPFTIVINPPRALRMMQEEIFGPILPIISYNTTQEAIDFVLADHAPLGLYIYAHDQPFIDEVSLKIPSGGVAVNVMGLQAAQPNLPFGGVGHSGMGMHHGEEGFKEFSNARGYFVKGGGSVIDLINPPYTQASNNFIEHVGYGTMRQQLGFALKRLPTLLWTRLVGGK